MSSTSSSEYACGQHRPSYETGYNTNYRSAFGSNPYYAMHPLIYYIQAPRPRNLIHRGRDRERGSPNCFIKAFRWYTKEHVPNRSESPVKPDMTGFAAWLDIKYDQFLQEGRLGSDMYHVKLKQTYEEQRVPVDDDCELCDSCTAKRFNEKRSTLSCRYIMQPKDTSRPPSIRCSPSNDALTLSEGTKKPLARSQSFSDVTIVVKNKKPCNTTPVTCDMGDANPICSECQNHTSRCVSRKQSIEIIEIPTKIKMTKHFSAQFGPEKATKVDAVTQYEVPPNSRQGSHASNQLQSSVYCERPSFETMSQRRSSRNSQGNMKSRNLKNFECQCPEEKLINTDAETQCSHRATINVATQPQRYTTKNYSCECDFKESTRNIQTSVQIIPISNDQLPPCTCERKIEEILITERRTFAQITSQTDSDHFICLEKETVKYPFFLKIICADKLSNEMMK